uniref:Uncharacterized protein n=1 Tax=Rhizophora mucronata TaxID=61149 RepID=A0A2P2QEP0_RHIMU
MQTFLPVYDVADAADSAVAAAVFRFEALFWRHGRGLHQE